MTPSLYARDSWTFNQCVIYYHIAKIHEREFDEHYFFAKLASHGISGAEAVEVFNEVEAAIKENEARRKFVVSYMHYSGENMNKLTANMHWKVYCEADGYGYQRGSELRKINGGYDWSHVRDSSIDGWKRMEKKLKSFGFKMEE